MQDIVCNAMAKVQYKVANALDKLKYEITDVDLEGITREGFIFKAKLLVENPFTRDIPTSTISYTFKINERVIATGTIPPKSLKANVKTKMEVPIEIAYKNIPNLGKELYIILAETYVIKCELDLVLTFIGEQCILLTIKGEKKVPSKSQLGKMLINSWKEKIKDVKMVSYAKRLV
ncbi:desiccation-related protein PCC27-45-like isoform X2 [Camellia sinensis]|uniref:desiccation-related protein PCC27-45-like isoform X2 n=1 Tax=Camellia sinensis TaxID=4442 RepID=UPI00103679BE|nr:desiccation-related protein PCC27-45-like isoform X2 [Camellia sinensis]